MLGSTGKAGFKKYGLGVWLANKYNLFFLAVNTQKQVFYGTYKLKAY